MNTVTNNCLRQGLGNAIRMLQERGSDMTVQYADCEMCGKHDITGYLAYKDMQLCPDCASKFIGQDANFIRTGLKATLKTQETTKGE